MELIYIDGLPPRTGKGELVRLLTEDGNLSRHQIGRIDLKGHRASIEVMSGKATGVVTLLDGGLVGTRQVRVWQAAQTGHSDHFDRLLRWLNLEAGAESEAIRRRAQTEGSGSTDKSASDYSLTGLIIRREDVGLGGIQSIEFGPRNHEDRIPQKRLTVGSPVLLTEEGIGPTGKKGSNQKPPPPLKGIISRLSNQRVVVGFQRQPDPIQPRPTFRLDLANDEISRERMEQALARVMSARNDRLAQLRTVLRGAAPAAFGPDREPASTQHELAHLNNAQQEAVRLALRAEDVAIIHGPPGTGKTTTVIALILRAVARRDRVLACAPSNLAVDNMAERLIAAGAGRQIVRLGHPIRVTEEVQQVTLDHLVSLQDEYKLAKKMHKEAADLLRQSGQWRRAKPAPGEKAGLRREARALQDEARQLEARAIELVLNRADVILTTLTGIDSRTLGQRFFDLCVIDEAGQSTEPATWIPLTRAQKVVLAGDHQQLPPTILSQQAAREGYGVSLLEQLMMRAGEDISRRLDIQYRMHAEIMGFSSDEFYEGTLIADERVSRHQVTGLPAVHPPSAPLISPFDAPILFIDTAGANYDEAVDPETKSRYNELEGDLIFKLATELITAGLDPTVIGVITPYSAQVNRLRSRFGEDPGSSFASIEVNSVDGFQGREKEVILISLVRSNEQGDIGFLAETRRINVALTRARRKLVIIGDSATLTHDPFYKRMVDHLESIESYRSVWELS